MDQQLMSYFKFDQANWNRQFTELADIMMQGDTYAVYYTEGSENDILSAELISKAR